MRVLWCVIALGCGSGDKAGDSGGEATVPSTTTSTGGTGTPTGTPAGTTPTGATPTGTTPTGTTGTGTTPTGTTGTGTTPTGTTGTGTTPTGTTGTGTTPTGTTPTGSTTDGDRDGDGLSDADEALYGTDPDNPDTDAGGLSDGGEVHYGRDPLDGADDLVEVLPDSADLRYTGRWLDADPLRPWASWQGSAVSTTFDGTAVSVVLDPGGGTEWFRAIIDGDHAGAVKLEVADGPRSVLLATRLPPGPHTLELVKETNGGTRSELLGLQVAGAGALAPPAAPAHRIAFYGDSNLAGVSLEHEADGGAAGLRGSHFTYAGIASRQLDAAYHNVSISGETIGSMTRKLDQMDSDSGVPTWDFARFVPEAIVVNLGANDVGRPVDAIRDSYVALFDALREAHGPDPHIVVFNAWGWDANEPANYTDLVVAEYADPNMSVATFPWVFEQWHGCETDHAGMAAVLVEHLSARLGWDAGPSDVVSGFGVGGDVANGSFEARAPFGGYGWRYRLDPGVRRIVDPARAHSGQAFVQLTDGDRIHQPSPASAGQVVTATLWLRGAADGEQARVQIDFRGQTLGTPPLEVTEQVVELATGWTRFVVSAEAPDDGVWHTRLTIGAVDAATVDVDSVSMEVE
ncbi:MAG: hypothetical protein ACI8PZ_007224 [Myxococcota bacterium]|jgi:hypothetical protein